MCGPPMTRQHIIRTRETLEFLRRTRVTKGDAAKVAAVLDMLTRAEADLGLHMPAEPEAAR